MLPGMHWKIELVAIPVTDVDRAKAFYVDQVGFHADHDHKMHEHLRFVQLTPPGSACSVQLVSDGSRRVHDLYLVTPDLATTRAELIARGVPVGDARHKDPVETWAGEFAPGLDEQRRDYASFADFADPDGNTWILQERR
jgi:catechol 2,3-dioxygenase-like lactoylglutathione lyase family enzyme